MPILSPITTRSHLGDARATDVTLRGELNVGQILREQLGDACFNVGFSTYTGTVSAASHWDGPVERKRVRPAMPGSYERLFHDTGLPKFVLHFRGPRASKELADALAQERLERAIGVIYRPRSERTSHMFHACLPRQVRCSSRRTDRGGTAPPVPASPHPHARVSKQAAPLASPAGPCPLTALPHLFPPHLSHSPYLRSPLPFLSV